MAAHSRTARYLTHPQVLIDPLVDVPGWSLSEVGHARVVQVSRTQSELSRTTQVISSCEIKAVQTAQPLATAMGVRVKSHPDMHENDRSATGFLPPEEFETVADQFFAQPQASVRGWERAVDAQTRIVRAVMACVSETDAGDILFVGHGGVGTLLFCALSNLPIDRRYDQGPGGGGNWFQFHLDTMKPSHGWRPMEELASS
ncbi:histidine phosphatase family protein [Ruegeria halocynthiae]|uniref:histidine phosphatase family protein n=1 Tax=Ruegeria halocynthiae TaxID=985054 RepID=UPI00056168FE|nr:histidine phosphatase family protein [Ruegeria halocynthiae]